MTSVVAGAVLALVAGVLVFVTRGDGSTSLSVGARGGVLAPSSMKVRLEVPRGAAADGTSISFGKARGTVAPPLGFVKQLGPSIAIVPRSPLRAGTLRFDVGDPAALPAGRAGARRTEPGDLFVAFYDPADRSWRPLSSQYDEVTREVVARAPHFSTFALFASVPGPYEFVRDGTKVVINVGQGAAKQIGAIAKTSGDWMVKRLETLYGSYLDDVNAAANDHLSPGKRIDDLCNKHPDDHWRVTSTSEEVSGCVTTAGAVSAAAGEGVPQGPGKNAPVSARPEMVLQSDRRLSYDLNPVNNPGWIKGPMNAWDAEDLDDVPQLLGRLFHVVAGGSFLAGPGRQQVAVPETQQADFSLGLSPNWLIVVTDVIEGALVMVPERAAVKEETTTALTRLSSEMSNGKVTIRSELEMWATLHQRFEVGKSIPGLRELDQLKCAVGVARQIGKLSAGDGNAFRDVLMSSLDCAELSWPGPADDLKLFFDPLEKVVSASRGLQALRQFWSHGRDFVQLEAHRQMSAEEARRLPRTIPKSDDGTSCPATAANTPPPPGAPSGPDHECAVDLDLDGNGKADLVVLWQKNDHFGAVAYLDDGSYHQLESAPESWTTDGRIQVNEFKPWVVIRDADGIRDGLAVEITFGSSTNWAAVLVLDRDDRLTTLTTEEGKVATLAAGGAYAYSSGFGCVRTGSTLYLAQSLAGRDPRAQSDTAGKAWELALSTVKNGVVSPVKRHLAGFNPVGGGWPQAMKGQFCRGLRADLGTLPYTPRSPGASVRTLLAAAAQRNAALGRAVIDAAFARDTSEHYGSDIWGFMTTVLTPADLRAWTGRPVSCPAGAGSDPEECKVVASNGYTIRFEMARLPEEAGGGSVVSGVTAGD